MGVFNMKVLQGYKQQVKKATETYIAKKVKEGCKTCNGKK